MTLQERRARAVLTATTLVNMTGSGVYITVLTLFLLEDRHLSAEAVAAVIAVTTLGGKLAAVPLSGLVNRFQGRPSYISAKLVSGAAISAMAFSHDTFWICVMAAIYNVGSALGGAARNLVIRDDVRSEPKIFRARLRSYANVGVVGGSVIGAGLLLWFPGGGAAGGILVNGFSCALCAGLSVLLPRTSSSLIVPLKEREESLVQALTSPSLVGVMFLIALFALVGPVTTFAIPVWVTEYVYPLDGWPVGALIATSAVIVVVFQVPIMRLLEHRFDGTRTLALAGTLLASGCVLLAASWSVAGAAALALVWLAVVVFALSEVVLSAGMIEFIFESKRVGYVTHTSTIVNLSGSVGEALGPVLLLAIAIHPTSSGWLTLALGIYAVVAAAVLVVRFRARGVS